MRSSVSESNCDRCAVDFLLLILWACVARNCHCWVYIPPKKKKKYCGML